MSRGVSKEVLGKLECGVTRDLVGRLLEGPKERLGCRGGMDEILEHEYFNGPEFCVGKDIYEGVEEIDRSDPSF
jgi:hypothetical protein